MGYSVARVGDTTHGTCKSSEHEDPIEVDGTIITGSPDINGNSLPVATIGCVVQSSCGHTGTINSGSPSVNGDGLAVARIGDTFEGTYYGTITSGSPDIFAE
jgi:uncharacterized Zn-binding protein involved in type VI secretion